MSGGVARGSGGEVPMGSSCVKMGEAYVGEAPTLKKAKRNEQLECGKVCL